MAKRNTEHRAFEAEVGQLLHLVAHSLYSHKEIFLRELISNAADALDRLRFEALADERLTAGDADLAIRLEADAKAGTLTVADNGIGMSEEEVVRNIGTIARSGTREFLRRHGDGESAGPRQIGQFGVGFYAAFIVADRVALRTRRAGGGAGTAWESDGRGGYDLERLGETPRGTAVTLHLKQDEREFLEDHRLREVVKRYSDHIPFPIRLRSRDDQGRPTEEWETVNQAQALWTRPPQELKDADYRDFYPHVAHDPNPPLAWTHHRVEGRAEYSLLLYLPATAPFDLADPNPQHGIKLYVQRVFVLEEPDRLLPRYLRFVRGVVDSSDLPLNVSRELLQNHRTLDTIRAACVKRVLDLLDELAAERPEDYAKFWAEFGRVFKEGAVEDADQRDRVLRLARFHSTADDAAAAPAATLAGYLERMGEGQKRIYFLTADSLAAARQSPHLEIFRRRGLEVLLLTDPVDEWLTTWVREYEGRPFQSVAKGELELPAADDADDADDAGAAAGDEELCARVKEALGDEVAAVRASARLTDSPSCLVRGEHDLSPLLQELMRRQGQAPAAPQLTLELNLAHPLLARMRADAARFGDWAWWLYEQAVLADGGVLKNPGAFVGRLNALLAGAAAPADSDSADQEAS